MKDARPILEFWFDEIEREQWWKKDDAFDAALGERFGDTHARAVAGKLARWQETPEGALALTIVLDQFSRNLYRGSPEAFAADENARAVADWAIDRGFDAALPTGDHRLFLYLPFMHHEDLDSQERCIALIDAGVEAENSGASARAHRDVIARFGRFPHRNAVLGRANTPEEEEYLKDPNAGW